MDRVTFDGLARKLGAETSRRNALRVAGTGLAAGLVPGLFLASQSDAAPLSSETCSPIGTKCGKRQKGKGKKAKRRQQQACNKCCSKFATKNNNGQRRCSCVPDIRSCRRNDQCCSGLCVTVAEYCGGDPECIATAPAELRGRKFCIPGIFGIVPG